MLLAHLVRLCVVAAAAAALAGCGATTPQGTVTFSGVVGGTPGIYDVDANGTHLARLAIAGSQLAWSPEGSALAFVRDGGLWTVSPPDATAHRVVRGPVYEYSWSPDGSRFAYRGDDFRLLVATRGGGRSRLTGDGRDPAWSPDGTLVAFLTSVAHINDQGEDEYVAVVRPDGTGRERLQVALATGVSWSPDSRRLVFAAPAEGLGDGSTARLYTTRVDGTDLRVVVPRARFDPQGGDWSPDGARIAYADATGTWVVDSNGGHLHRVSALAFAAWSPDGKWVAVQGARVVEVVSASGGRPRRVIDADSIDSVTWRPG